MLRDSARHDEPKLDTEHEHEKKAPVESGRATVLKMTRHRKRPSLHSRPTDVLKRYLVFHANQKNGTALAVTPTIQTHIAAPPFGIP
jgi:hypothetical protein